MQSRKSLNYVIFRQANALIRAAGLIETEIAKVFDEQKEVDDRIEMTHSVVLLRSLAIELYLKMMLIIDRDDVFSIEDIKRKSISFPTGKAGHSFMDLIKPLKDDIKAQIVKEFRKLDPKVQTFDDLLSVIDDVGNTPFVDWRYIYEKNRDASMNIIDLTNFAKALFQTAASMKGIKII